MALKDKTDASSATEVVKSALMVYETIVDRLAQNCDLMIHNPDGDVMIATDRPAVYDHINNALLAAASAFIRKLTPRVD